MLLVVDAENYRIFWPYKLQTSALIHVRNKPFLGQVGSRPAGTNTTGLPPLL